MDFETSEPRYSFESISTLRLCILLLTTLFVTACSGDPSKTYTFTVEYVRIEQDVEGIEESTAFESGTVSIYRVEAGESMEEELALLHSSPFHNGKVKLRGNLESPMWVEAQVSSAESSELLTSRSYVEPGETISLAVLDYTGYWQDELVHIGMLTNVQDPAKRFVLSADLSPLNADLTSTLATVHITNWTEKGLRYFNLATVMLQDDKFTLEIEIEEPTVAFLEAIDRDRHFNLWTEIIVEPGVTIHAHPRGSSSHATATLPTGWFQTGQDDVERLRSYGLVAVAGRGKHAKLVESWQQSYTFQLRLEELDKESEEQRNTMNATSAVIEETDESSASEESPDSQDDPGLNIEPSEGCEHVDLSNVLPTYWEQPYAHMASKVSELWNELKQIRFNVLDDIARHAVDPMDRLLALELHALDLPEERVEKLEIYENLAQSLSVDVARARVTPARDYWTAILESVESQERMVPGQRVPDFELPNLKGTPVSLYSVLNEYQLVLLEFLEPSIGLSSWTTDAHKELRDLYADEDFQIVQVLVGEEREQREDLSEIESYSWIMLRESNAATRSNLARSYAAVHKAASYFLDSRGCIIQRDLEREVARDFLSSYLDNPASQH